MIKLLKETELEYIRCFSNEVIEENVRRFWDDKFRDSYANNISILKDELNKEDLIRTINSQLENALRRGEYFLHFEAEENVCEDIIKRLRIKPARIDTLIYMAIDVKKYNLLRKNNSVIREAKEHEDLENIININIEDYAPIVGRSYATRRINRKIEVYKNDENNLKSIICYDGNVPVGSCEVIAYKKAVKIEDFGILEKFQNKGFGSSILRYVIEKAYIENEDIAYVITENNSVAKNIYEKLGFKQVSQKTQIIFDF